jgi:hypothetical protein
MTRPFLLTIEAILHFLMNVKVLSTIIEYASYLLLVGFVIEGCKKLFLQSLVTIKLLKNVFDR